ncbi:hypothetical protein ACFL4H_00035 [Candidatus Neomarinimicrobiota bacterium]
MALQKLDAQVFDQLGEGSGGALGITQAILDDWFTLGFRACVNRTQLYNRDKLWAFCTEAEILNSSGLALDTTKSGHIDNVGRLIASDKIYPCIMKPSILRGQMENPDSPHYAYSVDPACYKLNATLYIKPDPDATNKGYVSYVKYPDTVDASAIDSLQDVSNVNFPTELNQAVIYWVISRAKLGGLQKYKTKVVSELEGITGNYTSGTETFSAQTQVVVAHNSGAYPIVQIMDGNGVILIGQITHNSVNQFTVDFAVSQSGTIIYTVYTGGGVLANLATALGTIGTATTTPTVPDYAVAYTQTLLAAAIADIQSQCALAVGAVGNDDVELAAEYSRVAQQHVGEAQAAVADVQAKIRDEMNDASIEAQQFQGEVQMYVAELGSNFQKVQIYIQEIAQRLGVADRYIKLDATMLSEATAFEALFDREVRTYCGVNLVDKEER